MLKAVFVIVFVSITTFALTASASELLQYKSVSDALDRPVFIDAVARPSVPNYDRRYARVDKDGFRVFKIVESDGGFFNSSSQEQLYEIVSYFDENYHLNVRGQDFIVTQTNTTDDSDYDDDYNDGDDYDSVTRYKIGVHIDGNFWIKTAPYGNDDNGKYVSFDHPAKDWQVNRDDADGWEKLRFSRASVESPPSGSIIRIMSQQDDFLELEGSDMFMVRDSPGGGGGNDFVSLAVLDIRRFGVGVGVGVDLTPRLRGAQFFEKNNVKCLQFSWFFGDTGYIATNDCHFRDKAFGIGYWEEFNIRHEREGYFTVRNRQNDDSKLQKVPFGEWNVMKGDTGTWELFTIDILGVV